MKTRLLKTRKVVVAALIACACGVSPASAESIIFSNLGPGDSFNTSVAWIFGWSQENDEDVPQSVFWRAMQFEAQTTATLQTITAPIQWDQASPSRGSGTMQLVLYQDRNGLPGTALETITRTGNGGTGSPHPSLVSFESIVHPQLVAGLTYFLAAQTTGFAEGEWWGTADGNVAAPHQFGFNFDIGPWQPGVVNPGAAFRLTGDQGPAPVPEPGTGLLLLGGLGALLRARRRPPA